MQLRRFSAKNASEALLKVKESLGPDAIILSTKNRSRIDEKTGRTINYVEVVAAVDRGAKESSSVGKGRAPRIFQSRPKAQDAEAKLLKEIDELKTEIKQMHKALRELNERESALNAPGSDSPDDILRLSDSIASCLGLDKRGQNIVHRLLSSCQKDELCSLSRVVLRLRSFISSNIKPGPVAEDAKERCWWAFVGPTGVGKTTTLAKIAARLKFLCKRQGVFICVDGYRMGAREQLEKYANLMSIPLEIARTNKDLVRLFGEYKELDFIFVDTTGRNPFSSSHKTELERLFDSVPGLMAQVMLSATSKREDLMGAISFYRQFPLAGWTLTKTDETRSLASSVFPLIEADLPVSYVTNGQRVPEDIMHVHGSEIAELSLEPLKGLGRLLEVPVVQVRDHKKAVSETI